MFNYTRTAATALKLLQRFGQTVTLRRYATGTYDPATGIATSVPTDASVTAVVLPFGAGRMNGPGGLIEVGDLRVLMEPNAVPQVADHVIVGSDEYVVKGLLEYSPAGTPVLYDIHVRK